jgi:hypothetical protein
MGTEGGGKPPSYNNITANDRSGTRAKRPTFEPPQQIREQLLANEHGLRKEMDMGDEAGSSQAKPHKGWEPGKCIPQLEKAPRYLIKSNRVGEHTEFMKEHALIGKFLGLWPSERDLHKWIKHWWNPRGDYEVQLSSKGFFTIILYNLEDKDRIFENGPYFFNSAGLFLRFWTERFSPDKEDFTMAPVWIRLYSLPQEFWLEEILTGIGNTIGLYVRASEATKQRKYTSYARICVYMNISKALPGSITLEYQDEDWQQTLDYEHIPFRCRRCHEHGHLFRDCPLTKITAKANEPAQKDGFTTVAAKRRNPTKRPIPEQKKNIETKNPYEILKHLPEEGEIQDPHNLQKQAQDSPTDPAPPPQSQEAHMDDRGEGDGDTPMQLDERDLAGIDLEKLEEALNQKDLQTLPEEQLRKVHKVFLNSSAGSTARLGIASDSNTGLKKIPRESKRRGRKTAQQLIREAGNLMINSGQIHKISEVYLHTPSSTQ